MKWGRGRGRCVSNCGLSCAKAVTRERLVQLGFSSDEVSDAIAALGQEVPLVFEDMLRCLAERQPTVTAIPPGCLGVGLRRVVLDGMSLGLRYGQGRVFDARGIELAVNWFQLRGHVVSVVLPSERALSLSYGVSLKSPSRHCSSILHIFVPRVFSLIF